MESLGFDSLGFSSYTTPYRLSAPIDSVIHEQMSPSDRDALRLSYQKLVGSLNWLAHTTDRIYLQLYRYWTNIRAILLLDIWMLPVMQLSI